MGYLPTTAALITRKLIIDDKCPWCHGSIESDVHVLFQCDFARTV